MTVAISLSDMPWWWRRKWSRLADGCRQLKAASSELAKGLLEGGLRHCFGDYPACGLCVLLQEEQVMETRRRVLAPEKLTSREPLSALLVMFAP